MQKIAVAMNPGCCGDFQPSLRYPSKCVSGSSPREWSPTDRIGAQLGGYDQDQADRGRQCLPCRTRPQPRRLHRALLPATSARNILDVVVEAARQSAASTPRVHFVIAEDTAEKPRLFQNCAICPMFISCCCEPEERLRTPQFGGPPCTAAIKRRHRSRAAVETRRHARKRQRRACDSRSRHRIVRSVANTAILVPAGDSRAMAREIGDFGGEGNPPGAWRRLQTAAKIFDREISLAKFAAILGGHASRDPGAVIPKRRHGRPCGIPEARAHPRGNASRAKPLFPSDVHFVITGAQTA